MINAATRAPVTVIVPTFNRATFLKEAIASLLDQTVSPERILVVDDGSTDQTAAAVATFGSRVDYLRKQNGGKSSALNLALSHVDSELVWIFDDDDIADPAALQHLSDGLRNAPECGFSYGSYKLFTVADDGTRTLIDREFPSVPSEELFVALMGRCFIHQPGLLVRRHCYDAVGPFDEGMLRSQDFEMMLRLARHCRGVEVPGPVFFQRQHQGLRGTASFAVQAADVDSAWKRFDQRILTRQRENCALEEFLPYRPSVLPLIAQDRLSALLERCTLMGRRGLWELAAEDLEAAVSLANKAAIEHLTTAQSGILHRLFDVFSNGAVDFRRADRFRRALAQIASPTLARDLRLGMSWGLPYRIRLAVTGRQFSRAALLSKIYLQIAPPDVMAAGVARKLLMKVAQRSAA
jgi:glycosyltransferase involved in cell wall biosynthesis